MVKSSSVNPRYVPPRVLGMFSLEPGESILQLSAQYVEFEGVDTVGQKVDDIDLTNTKFFQHEWQ